jgi:hypothetical protein
MLVKCSSTASICVLGKTLKIENRKLKTYEYENNINSETMDECNMHVICHLSIDI